MGCKEIVCAWSVITTVYPRKIGIVRELVEQSWPRAKTLRVRAASVLNITIHRIRLVTNDIKMEEKNIPTSNKIHELKKKNHGYFQQI